MTAPNTGTPEHVPLLRTNIRLGDLLAALKREQHAAKVRGQNGRQDIADQTIVLEGDFYLGELRAGLRVHATDALEKVDGASELMLHPELTVSILLEGDLVAELDGNRIDFGTESGVRGKIWSLTRPARLVRHLRAGERIRKVKISVSRDWLRSVVDEHDLERGAFGAFISQHLAMADWQPSRDAAAHAAEILAGYGKGGIPGQLSVEMHALAILREAFSRFDNIRPPSDTRPQRRSFDATRASAIRTFIEREEAANLTLNDIAQATGMSVSTMQRVFKRHYGVTVMDFLRSCRLERVRAALAVGGLSIQQAAFIAGYSSPANFSTAFRRQFGYPPSQA